MPKGHVDDKWWRPLYWVEGKRRTSDGDQYWFGLYCFENQARANGVASFIKRNIRDPRCIKEGLTVYSDFRVREEPPEGFSFEERQRMLKVDYLQDLRNNPGGWALLETLRKLYPCGRVNGRTGGICQVPTIVHSGKKHTSTV